MLTEGDVEVSPRLKTKLTSLLFIAVLMCLGAVCASASAESKIASTTSTHIEVAAESTANPKDVEHGPTQKAVEIARPFGFPITNSMVVSWIVAVGLIVFSQLATRHMKLIPKGAQNFWEWLVDGLYTFLEGIIGPHWVKRTFWFFATVPARLLERSSVRQCFRGGKHAACHGYAGSQPELVIAGSILFSRVAGGSGSGVGVHVSDCCLHIADLPA